MFRRPEALAVCPPGGEPRERGMFLNQTANYGLSQWEATDRILMEDFNSDNSKIDAALKCNADTIMELKAQTAATQTNMEKKGNCKIEYQAYTGNGAASRTHTFSGIPQVVLIISSYFQLMAIQGCPLTLSLLSSNHWDLNTVWSGTSLTVSYAGTYAGGEEKMGNKQGATYYMVALIQADT